LTTVLAVLLLVGGLELAVSAAPSDIAPDGPARVVDPPALTSGGTVVDDRQPPSDSVSDSIPAETIDERPGG